MQEAFSQSIDDIHEKQEIQQHIQQELAEFRTELSETSKQSFYEKADGKVTYDLHLVKEYLHHIKDLERKYLSKNRYGARVMAIQIALEFIAHKKNLPGRYDTGKIDGILWKNTEQAVKHFQKDHNEKEDGKAWTITITTILQQLAENTTNPEIASPATPSTETIDEGTSEGNLSVEDISDTASELPTNFLEQELNSAFLQRRHTLASIIEMRDGNTHPKEWVEQQDQNGKTYLLLQWKKFYKNAESGLWYTIENTEMFWNKISTITIGNMKNRPEDREGLQIVHWLEIGDIEVLKEGNSATIRMDIRQNQRDLSISSIKMKNDGGNSIEVSMLSKAHSLLQGTMNTDNIKSIGTENILEIVNKLYHDETSSTILTEPVPITEPLNHEQKIIAAMPEAEREKYRKKSPRQKRRYLKAHYGLDTTQENSPQHPIPHYELVAKPIETPTSRPPSKSAIEETISALRPALEMEGTYTFSDGNHLQGTFVLDHVVAIDGRPLTPPLSFNNLDTLTPQQRKFL